MTFLWRHHHLWVHQCVQIGPDKKKNITIDNTLELFSGGKDHLSVFQALPIVNSELTLRS